jgi:hypothetical protein
MKWADDHGNVHIRHVSRPQVISHYFSKSNNIDTHNQLRQFELALEKKWVTHDAFFRIMTSIFGINNTDAYLLCDYHGLLGTHHTRPSIVEFTSALSYQLIHYFDDGVPEDFRSTPTLQLADNVNDPPISDLSAGPSTESEDSIRPIKDKYGRVHSLKRFEVTTDSKGRRHTKARECAICKVDPNTKRNMSCFYCSSCPNEPAYCTPSTRTNGHERDCYAQHISDINEKYDKEEAHNKLIQRRKRMRRISS